MKKIFGIIMVMIGVCSLSMLSMPVSADSGATGGATNSASSCGSSFLGFYPWYYGLTDGSCEIMAPTDTGDGVGIAQFIWAIVLNIVADMMLAVGYIAVGVTIWGGFYMITSNGDPGKVAKARKILTGGVSGALIAIFASIIAHALISVVVQG